MQGRRLDTGQAVRCRAGGLVWNTVSTNNLKLFLIGGGWVETPIRKFQLDFFFEAVPYLEVHGVFVLFSLFHFNFFEEFGQFTSRGCRKKNY